jgi:hypothetical protein
LIYDTMVTGVPSHDRDKLQGPGYQAAGAATRTAWLAPHSKTFGGGTEKTAFFPIAEEFHCIVTCIIHPSISSQAFGSIPFFGYCE